ncbi:vacuolar protein sorting-associating protein, putative [Phytophthora infestans T30-4]|uniref:vesicle-fusing ATPase n=2 Tax=Phytophthora infestans TaxID=4787 RepID=D0NW36_PHYIT|nr:vacuolar protein sorting-associating protein, putative [Phytophthora infestans T30-4]EEY66878.1 vacuolar protein sorting-associating protein, putative [Phytophthora infestans T30-4]KAF4036309.1 Vps4 C terminal oligomerization domain [Phytophthora infestans]KAF4149857.1 Vps4 C terminal oligomerization domain [Phytophthora infestans]|eukprot:XP_002896687.1 vacuolar protein sorting-associating protein, putative [Phytophthora infestans T30-4]
MENRFIPQAIEIVTQAINEDNGKNYHEAFRLYKKALEHFMVGVKYEKNPTSKEVIMKRVEGYMTRAEQLRGMLEKENAPKPVAAAVDIDKGDKEDDDETDVETAKLRGSLASAVVSEKPNVKWDDVAGLDAAKEALKEAVILPARFPQLFTGKRRPWKGILLYGPPGTGKSYLAQAVATEADATFFSVSSSSLVSKWQGESEKLVKNLFEMAREKKPAIVFIDEIDSLCSSRSEGESDSTRRIKNEFLVQMQGMGNNHDGVLVLGATNVPWELDPAMRRRFEKRIYIPLPDINARKVMLGIHLGDTPNELSDNNFAAIAEKTEGCSGSDISVLVRDALMEPLRKCQQAQFFTACNDKARPVRNGQFLTPCEDDPPCAYCHMKLSSCRSKCPDCKAPCQLCGALRMRLYDLPERGYSDEKLRPPMISMSDFTRVLAHSTATVAPDELNRFVKWTQEFGQEG